MTFSLVRYMETGHLKMQIFRILEEKQSAIMKILEGTMGFNLEKFLILTDDCFHLGFPQSSENPKLSSGYFL